MIRRDFLKAVSAALAAIAVPAGQTSGFVPVSEYANEQIATDEIGSFVGFNPAFQYGNAVLTQDDPALAAKAILEHARLSLPKGTPFVISSKSGVDDEYEEAWTAVYWKYTPNLKIGDPGVFVA
jgi:hypothetical protein